MERRRAEVFEPDVPGHRTRAMVVQHGKGARQRVLAREAREQRK